MLFITKEKYEDLVLSNPLKLKDDTTFYAKEDFWYRNQHYRFLTNIDSDDLGVVIRVSSEMDVLLCMGYGRNTDLYSVCVPSRCRDVFWKAYNYYEKETDHYRHLKYLEGFAIRVFDGRTDCPDNLLVMKDNIERALTQAQRLMAGKAMCNPKNCEPGIKCHYCEHNN
jgi:hypothetical protein